MGTFILLLITVVAIFVASLGKELAAKELAFDITFCCGVIAGVCIAALGAA